MKGEYMMNSKLCKLNSHLGNIILHGSYFVSGVGVYARLRTCGCMILNQRERMYWEKEKKDNPDAAAVETLMQQEVGPRHPIIPFTRPEQ
jgi:hypothetical protein